MSFHRKHFKNFRKKFKILLVFAIYPLYLFILHMYIYIFRYLQDRVSQCLAEKNTLHAQIEKYKVRFSTHMRITWLASFTLLQVTRAIFFAN